MFQPSDPPPPIPEGSTAPPAPHKSPENVNRACESCRMLKVRCLPDETSTTGKCKRCAKANRPCHYAAPQKRRPRKRTDTRVAELEREVRAMRSLLNKSGSGSSPEKHLDQDESGEHDDLYDDPPTQSSGEAETNPPSEDPTPLINHQTFGIAPHVWPLGGGNSGSGEPRRPLRRFKDVVDRGIVTLETATKMFEVFATEMVEHLPIFVIPEGRTSVDLRDSKPVLWLAAITAGAGKNDDALYSLLHEEILHVYADRVIIKGEKSVELVQSMMITAIWHYPPEDFKKLKFYQFIHMAAMMALDIGLGGQSPVGVPPVHPILPTPENEKSTIDAMSERFNIPKEQLGSRGSSASDKSKEKRGPPSALVLECQRTFLSCYLLCSSVAMALRRPNMLNFSSYMTECLDNLEKHSNLLSDRRLAAWVHIQRLSDEYAASFAFDDPNSRISLSDPRIQLTLKAFEKRLEEWKNSVDTDVVNVALAVHYHQNNIFFHEFSIYDYEDRSPPYLTGWEPGKAKPFSPGTVGAIMTCIDSTHAILDAFLSMDMKIMEAMPVIIYVRMAYSLVLLIKISISITGSGFELGQIMDVESLKVEHYLTSLKDRIKQCADNTKYRVPGKFLFITGMLQKWYYRRPKKDSSTAAQTLIKGISNLDVGKESESPTHPFPKGLASMPEVIDSLSSLATPSGSDNSSYTPSERRGMSEPNISQPEMMPSNYPSVFGNIDLMSTTAGMDPNLMAPSGTFQQPYQDSFGAFQPGLTLPGNETFPMDMDMDLDFLNLFGAPTDLNFNTFMTDDNLYSGFNYGNPPS